MQPQQPSNENSTVNGAAAGQGGQSPPPPGSQQQPVVNPAVGSTVGPSDGNQASVNPQGPSPSTGVQPPVGQSPQAQTVPSQPANTPVQPGVVNSQQPQQPQNPVPAPSTNQPMAQPTQPAPGASGQPPLQQQNPVAQPQQASPAGAFPGQPPQQNTPGIQQQPPPQPQGQAPTYVPQNSGGTSSRSLKKAIIVAVAVIGGAVVLGGALLFVRGMTGVNISYDEMTTTVTTAENSQNIAIDHPVEFEERSKTGRSFRLDHTEESTGGFIGQINADAMFIGEQAMTETKQEFDQLKDKSGEFYELFMGEVFESIESEGATDITVGDFTTFENADGSITDGLIVDIDYQVPLVDDDSELADVTGRVIFAFGESLMFFASVEALEEVWVDNQALFDEVINSTRIED